MREWSVEAPQAQPGEMGGKEEETEDDRSERKEAWRRDS